MRVAKHQKNVAAVVTELHNLLEPLRSVNAHECLDPLPRVTEAIVTRLWRWR